MEINYRGFRTQQDKSVQEMHAFAQLYNLPSTVRKGFTLQPCD